MANVQQKNGLFHVRFRYAGKQFKRSIKTRDPMAARAAQAAVEVTLYRLLTGQVHCPTGVDLGDFIVSGGTLAAPAAPPMAPPSTGHLIDEYLAAMKSTAAESYYNTQAIHLRHLCRGLGRKAEQPCDQLSFRDLDRHLRERLVIRTPTTVSNERVTIKLFFSMVSDAGPSGAIACSRIAHDQGQRGTGTVSNDGRNHRDP